jgi:hypothetical protein
LTGEDSEPQIKIKLEPAAAANAGKAAAPAAAAAAAPATATAVPPAVAAAADGLTAQTAAAGATASGQSTGMPSPATPAAAAAGGFTLQPFDCSDLPGALGQLLQLLDHMAAADDLMERFDHGVEALASLPDGHPELRLFGTRYASVQIWARKGRFDKVFGVIDAMLRGLGV